MFGDLRSSTVLPDSPALLFPPQMIPLMERAHQEDRSAASPGEEPTFFAYLGVLAACARLARTRNPLAAADAFASALSDPLLVAERGTADRLARALRASYAAIDPVASVRFVTHLDARIHALGESAVEWAEPTAAPDTARESMTDSAMPTTSAVSLAATADATELKEGTTVSTSTRGRQHTRDDGRAVSSTPDWRAQLATLAGQLPSAPERVPGAAVNASGQDKAPASIPTPPATQPLPIPGFDLNVLMARRARIVERDRERRLAAAANLARRAEFLDRMEILKAELVAIRRERELIATDLVAAFTHEAREELAALATELERADAARTEEVAWVESRLASLALCPDMAALLARPCGAPGVELPDTPSAAGATRRRSEEDATTIVPPIVASEDEAQAHGEMSVNNFPTDPAPAVPLENVGQESGAVKGAALLDAIGRARCLLRAGDADAAIAALGGVDLAGVEREIGRQAVGVLFAAAEQRARAEGMDDFRYLRTDRGGRILMACEPAVSYGDDGAAAAPTYRVVAACGVEGERYAPGQPASARMLELAQPRRARS